MDLDLSVVVFTGTQIPFYDKKKNLFLDWPKGTHPHKVWIIANSREWD